MFRKELQPLQPLVEQLAAVNEYERVSSALRDERRGHNGLAEGGRGRQHAMILRDQSVEGLHLWLAAVPPGTALGSQERLADLP